MIVNGYRAMWVFVMFDLPVKTKKQRKAATQFRKQLLEDGFMMFQYSVYGRPCPSLENTDVHTGRVRGMLPPEGEVRVLQVTDKQFGRMRIFHGKRERGVEQMPRQLEFF